MSGKATVDAGLAAALDEARAAFVARNPASFLGEFTAGLYGHSHPAILGAIRAAQEDGINLGAHTTAEARLARAVRERFPSMELMRFTNSGTEANLMALAAALAHTGRRKILAFEGGYHGVLMSFYHGGPSPFNVPHENVLAPY